MISIMVKILIAIMLFNVFLVCIVNLG